MPRWLQVVLHAALIALNIGLTTAGVIPAKYSALAGIAQAALGYVAQQYNTDGTPQASAYVPPVSPPPPPKG